MATKTISRSNADLENARYMTKVYSWMAIALCVTAGVASWAAGTPSIVNTISGNPLLLFGLLILELVLVGTLAVAVMKMSVMMASWTFLAYSAINGLTLSFIFLVYTQASIALSFYVTAGTFAVMSFYGYTTKRDLTSIGNLAFMALIGLIIATIVNIFFNNPIFYWITTYAGILIFVALTAYDTQKIKNLNIIGNEGTDEDKKEAIRGALTLYLDFINLFLMLLRVFGQRRRD